jgi:hypothetical protein
MTYVQFHEFVHRMVQNENEYRRWYKNHHSIHTRYIVGPMQQIGTKLYFNIDKVSKQQRNSTNNNNNNNYTAINSLTQLSAGSETTKV